MSTAGRVANQDAERPSARLLPLSKDPYQAPMDRDMLPSELTNPCRAAESSSQ
jgi:hypothetical protein